MIWAYGLENGKEIKRNNANLFMVIKKMNVAEDKTYFDLDSSDRIELLKLLSDIQAEDSLVIRSLEDLANSGEDLLSVLQSLTDKRIDLISLKENYLSKYNYYDEVKGLFELEQYFTRMKRTAAYQKAVDEGKVGRPSADNAEKCISLYLNGVISKEEVLTMAKISEPTFYRYLRRVKNEKCL